MSTPRPLMRADSLRMSSRLHLAQASRAPAPRGVQASKAKLGPRARVARLAISLHTSRMLAAFDVPLSWGELLKRTAKETSEDDCLGLAAQLAYCFFLALFPAVLFVLALASFFPLTNFIDDVVRVLRPIAPADVLGFLEEQLRRISNADSGGILTIGILGAIWSSSAAARGNRRQSQPRVRH